MSARATARTSVAAENYSVEALADSLALLVIPFDSVQPHLYDAAYSLPFYAPFDFVVVSSAIYDRYLSRPTRISRPSGPSTRAWPGAGRKRPALRARAGSGGTDHPHLSRGPPA